MRGLRFVLAIGLWAALTPLAAARPQDPAMLAFGAGAFMDAASEGERAGSAAGLVLASRALMAEAVTGGASGSALDALLARARTNAERALARDPASVEARLQLALSLGMIGRRASVAEALRHGYAHKARRLIDEALARSPNEAWAHAILGSWHLEIVRRGGPAGAALYGASVKAGIKEFETARRLAPRDPAIAYQYAVTLLDHDANRFSAQASTLLAAVDGCSGEDAFASRIREKAARVRLTLRSQGADAARRIATARFS